VSERLLHPPCVEAATSEALALLPRVDAEAAALVGAAAGMSDTVGPGQQTCANS